MLVFSSPINQCGCIYLYTTKLTDSNTQWSADTFIIHRDCNSDKYRQKEVTQTVVSVCLYFFFSVFLFQICINVNRKY